MRRLSFKLGLGCVLAFNAVPGRTAIAPPPAASMANVLAVGDQAPPFQCGRWVKGGVEGPFRAGHIYVVELWATWCGPCKMAIPQLTELAKEYKGKVTFIGVDVLERGQDPKAVDAKVDAFVKEMGARMEYHVCRDTADSYITRTWFKAAHGRGIPMAFVVDGGRRIAWIGNPLEGLEDALPAVLRGDFDARAFDSNLQVQSQLNSEYRQAMKHGEHAAALGLVDQMTAPGPKGALMLATLRLGALVHLDDARAEQAYDTILRQGGNLEGAGAILAAQDGLAMKWYLRSVELLTTATENSFRTLAKAQYKAGQKAGARASLDRYIAWARAERAKMPEKASSYDHYIREAEADREKYR